MKVVWTARARADLFDAYAYLKAQSPRAAERIVSRIVERVENQVWSPFAAPIEREGPERCLVVTRTPYIVIYDIEGDALRVVAVIHGAQNR